MSSYFDATKPESDVDSQDAVNQDVNSQLTVARGLASSAPLPLSTLLSLPCLSTSDVRGSMSRLSPSGLAYFR